MKKTKIWLRAAGLRAVRTFAQTAAAAIGVSTALGEVHWAGVGSTAALSALLSLLTSLAGLPEIREEEIQNDEGN